MPKTDEQRVSRAKDEIQDDAARFEADYRNAHPYQWWTTLLAPALLTVLVLVLLTLAHGGGFTRHLVVRAFAAFFFFGKFAILEPTSALSSEALFGLIVYMDIGVAVFISFHMALLFRLPVIGKSLLTLASDGEFIMQAQPWMRRTTFVGLVAFVMFPIAATGSIGGAIFGRLLGLRRLTTFLGVATGSLLGCGLMYSGAEVIRQYADRDDPLLKLAGIAVVAGVLLFLNQRYKKAKARAGYR